MTDNVNAEFDMGGASAPPDLLARLHEKLAEAISLETAVAQMDEDLTAARKALHTIKTGAIPDLMAQLQMDDLTHKGWKVKVQDFVSGSLPKDEGPHQKAIAWLEDHDGASLIKTSLSLSFGRSDHERAVLLAADLTEQGYEPKVESGVHSSTLQAFARERIRNGDEIDTETLGLYTGKVAKFTAPKESK